VTDGADPGPKAVTRADDARPIVPLPSAGPPAIAVVTGCVVLALGLFVLLEGRREQAVHTSGVHPAQRELAQRDLEESAASPPPLDVPPAPPPPAPPRPAPPPPPEIRYIERPGPPVDLRLERPTPPQPPAPAQNVVRTSEPALVIDNSAEAGKDKPAEDAAARATVLHHKANIVLQGALIPAVLETPIDSGQAGQVRAITSTDTRGFDGSRVLIPKGSRLVGEYRAETLAGQNRVLVTWTSLSRPDGVWIRLASPAADPKGEPGISGTVNNHMLARISNAVLQSAFTAGVDLASLSAGNGSVIVQGSTQAVGGAAGQALIPTGDARPTIKVKQGTDITVFVARNLDFSGAIPR